MAGVWDTYPDMLLVRNFLHCYCCSLLISLFLESFGAAFTSFYRLVGPFRSDAAPRVIKTEIWDTITRRGFMGNLMMGVIPMAFYAALNLTAWTIEHLLGLVVVEIV